MPPKVDSTKTDRKTDAPKPTSVSGPASELDKLLKREGSTISFNPNHLRGLINSWEKRAIEEAKNASQPGTSSDAMMSKLDRILGLVGNLGKELSVANTRISALEQVSTPTKRESEPLKPKDKNKGSDPKKTKIRQSPVTSSDSEDEVKELPKS